jgi:hypothetical protein
VAGSYVVIATQTLSGQSNTAQATATVADNTVLLAYTLAITNVGCNANGSFDLYLEHTSTLIFSAQTFWLQRYNEEDGTWGHPETGVPYSRGMANMLNSIQISNSFLNINFSYTGQFRIVKMFFSYQSGGTGFTTCVVPIEEFTFTGMSQIDAIYSFPCDNGLAEVVVEATGKDPLTYYITAKGGKDFVINNCQSNVFLGLEAAVYSFRVIDDCNGKCAV